MKLIKSTKIFSFQIICVKKITYIDTKIQYWLHNTLRFEICAPRFIALTKITLNTLSVCTKQAEMKLQQFLKVKASQNCELYSISWLLYELNVGM